MVRVVMLMLLPLVIANWTQLGDTIPRSSDTVQVAETAVDVSNQAAERDMVVGRYYMSKRDYTAAINRFKTIVTHYPASPYVEEALAHLAKSYLTLLSEVRSGEDSPYRENLASEAQTAVAVLNRKFPISHFSAEAHDALTAAALDPVENEKSWISKASK
jgi:outer membrane protein assembly factor BamD